MLVLVQTRKVTEFPIVLVGRDYWVAWWNGSRTTAVPGGTISPGDVDLLSLTDDPEEAVALATAGH